MAGPNSQVTISDFLIALCDLAEAESRALQESLRLFLTTERQAMVQAVLTSGWNIALIAAAVISLLLALGLFTLGGYRLCQVYVSPLATPFIIGGVWLVLALIFFLLLVLNNRKGKN